MLWLREQLTYGNFLVRNDELVLGLGLVCVDVLVCIHQIYPRRIHEDCSSLMESVQNLSYVGDKRAFEVLPPILMHPHETVSVQQVWSTLDTNGYFNSQPSLYLDHVLLGAAILPVGGVSNPVLLLANHEKKQVVACLYDVMFSHLESDLYRQRGNPSDIEIHWKGFELSVGNSEKFYRSPPYGCSLRRTTVSSIFINEL